MPVTDSKLYGKIAGLGKAAGVAAGVFGAPLITAGAFGADALAKANPFKYPVKPGKQSKEMLAADLQTLRTNPEALGMTEAEKEKMRADAVQTASAQNQAQSSQLAQSALAGQGFQQGAFNQAQQALGESAADAGVKAGSSINELNNRIIESESQRIRDALEAERKLKMEKDRFWLNLGIQGVGAVISAAMGGGASPLSGLQLPGSGGASGGSTTNVNVETGSPTDVSDALAEAEDTAALTGYR